MSTVQEALCLGPELVDRLRRHVDVLAELIGPRHVGKPAALASAAAYIEREFAALGDEVERQEYDAGGATVANLIVERRGRTQPDSIVVLGAHYDTIPGTPGADDNASAVAVLIESARLLHGRGGQRTVRFVALACEEPPHYYTDTMGSQVYARRCRMRSERLVGMLCLEMVGYSSFWDQGYPALMLTDTSFLRNPHYHQSSDRADTLDYERMAQVACGVAGGVSRLAGIPGGDRGGSWRR